MKRSSLCCSRSARTPARASRPTARNASRARSRSRRSSRRWRGRASAAARKPARPRTVPPSMTLSSTEASPTRRGVWKVRAMPRPTRVCGAPGGSAAAADADRARLRPGEAADRVQRRGLAAAVGADQAVHLAGKQVEIDPVDGPHGAEAERDAAQRQRRRHGRRCRSAGQQLGARHDGAAGLQRAAAGGIEQLGDAARQHQHDREQQRRVEEGGPGDQRRRELPAARSAAAWPAAGPARSRGRRSGWR